jgi:hypothetical protein
MDGGATPERKAARDGAIVKATRRRSEAVRYFQKYDWRAGEGSDQKIPPPKSSSSRSKTRPFGPVNRLTILEGLDLLIRGKSNTKIKPLTRNMTD